VYVYQTAIVLNTLILKMHEARHSIPGIFVLAKQSFRILLSRPLPNTLPQEPLVSLVYNVHETKNEGRVQAYNENWVILYTYKVVGVKIQN